jgi:ATP-dependent Clp protease protease subunit
MGTIILTGGAAGQRYALPNATIHMHPSSGGAKGYTEDVRIAYREQERLQHKTFQVISRHSGRPLEEVEQAFKNDHFMTAQEAQAFGLVDEVLNNDAALPALAMTSALLPAAAERTV